MNNLDHQTIELAFFAVIALALAVQAIVLVAVFVVMRKTARNLSDQLQETRESVAPIVAAIPRLVAAITPLVETSRDLLTKVSPKMIETSTDLAALTKSLRAQSADVQVAATEIIARARRQAERIDGLLADTIDAVERAAGFMTGAVSKPVRQVSALLASVKAAVEALRVYEPRARANRDQGIGDNDMFV